MKAGSCAYLHGETYRETVLGRVRRAVFENLDEKFAKKLEKLKNEANELTAFMQQLIYEGNYMPTNFPSACRLPLLVPPSAGDWYYARHPLFLDSTDQRLSLVDLQIHRYQTSLWHSM